MLNQVEVAKQKWGGSEAAIDDWLNNRKKLLVQYCQLAGLPPFEKDKQALPCKDSIQSFCELLMDYVSAGHFEFYDKLSLQNSNLDADLVEKLYPNITKSTDKALSFNDAYAELDEDEKMATFDTHLSELGVAMEERFELEDQLIQHLVETAKEH